MTNFKNRSNLFYEQRQWEGAALFHNNCCIVYSQRIQVDVCPFVLGSCRLFIFFISTDDEPFSMSLSPDYAQ